MTDYDPKEIFNEPIFLNTIPENIDISEEKYEGISPYLPFIKDWNSISCNPFLTNCKSFNTSCFVTAILFF